MASQQDSINARLHVSLNGVGTAYYDPRPAVAEFLRKKNRRCREPDREVYRERDFVTKFFRDSGAL
jgi:hypothetical protein